VPVLFLLLLRSSEIISGKEEERSFFGRLGAQSMTCLKKMHFRKNLIVNALKIRGQTLHKGDILFL